MIAPCWRERLLIPPLDYWRRQTTAPLFRANDMDNDEQYTGCVLCIHGRFIAGPYPQKVRCAKLGTVTERQECEHFQGPGPIKEIDPLNPPTT